MKLAICDDSTQEKNLKDFLGNWPLSRVRTMPLSDYTRVNNQSGNEFKDSYCYALEHLTPVGIGGANSLKFQIYEFKNESKIKHTNSDSRYAWHNSLGSTAEVAYSKIRDLIIRVIEAAQAANYNAIDSIPLVSTLKWKIAFLYQNQDNPGVVGCVSEKGLRQYFESKGEELSHLTVSQLHARAINDMSDQPSMHEIGRQIWNTVKKLKSKPDDDQEFIEKIEEPKNQFNLNFISIKECNRLTASPFAYHWLYKVTPDDGDNSFNKRRQDGNIVMNYLPEQDYRTIKPDDNNTNRNSEEGMAQLFATGMQINDIIHAYDIINKIISGIGIVTGQYEFNTQATDNWKHTRKVYWIPLNDTVRIDVESRLINKQLTGMLFDPENDANDFRFFIKENLNLAGLDAPNFMPKINRAPLGTTPAQGNFQKRWTEKISEENKPTMRILYGPPGTGKTYRTSQEVFEICMESGRAPKDYLPIISELKLRGNVEFVTFHQNYDYSDFIEGYRPHTNENGQMSYKLQDGVLKRIAKRAMNFPNQPFVLIIDEINRGNISRIFGELITLIEADKRIGERNETFLTLPYSCESFCLPSNLSIIGTMNTADRSIAVLDTALRRRFEFRRMNPDSKVLSQGFGKMLEEFNKELIEEYGLSFDQQIGHAWFMNINKKPKNSQDNDIDVTLESIFMNKILPLLEEWFYGEDQKLKQIVSTFCKDYPDKSSYKKDNKWKDLAIDNK